MCRLRESCTELNVKLFLVRVMVNYHKNLRYMAAAGRPKKDVFQPFAKLFFRDFFDRDHGMNE